MDHEYNQKAQDLVDAIKKISADNGLGGEASEYKLVTQSFLYKFLNDKFLYEIAKINPELQTYEDLKKLSDNDYSLLLMKLGNNSANLRPEHLLPYLFAHQNHSEFAKAFDDTLNDIAVTNSDVFSVHTDGNTEIRLFDERLVQDSVSDKSKHNVVAKAIINKLADSKFNFDDIFSAGFDFFSRLFEHMIKDYNKDGGGKYAEYYTPHSVAKIMAEILVGDSEPSNVKVYDPSAGSGTLLMNIASKIGTDKSTIYSQDISQKSSNLLRLNLILNGLSHSINNIVQGNTILHNKHSQKMDFIVSNPPFKLDFSDWRDDLESQPHYTERFFAGVPNVPKNDLDKMSIYLLFIQHIVWMLNDTGKAAVVVPTGFVTAQSGIEKSIRQKLVDNKWLKGVVSMPSNIFATTGTNVSILFIDKTNTSKVVLVDASKLGKKVKDGKNQKTLLSLTEEQKIIEAFGANEAVDDLSVLLDYAEIKEKNYSLSASQYFDIRTDRTNITTEEFNSELEAITDKLENLYDQSNKIKTEVKEQISKLRL